METIYWFKKKNFPKAFQWRIAVGWLHRHSVFEWSQDIPEVIGNFISILYEYLRDYILTGTNIGPTLLPG